MATWPVQMPDGSIHQVQGTTQSAAVNNAGPGASAPGSGTPSGSGNPGGGNPGGGSGSGPSGNYQTGNGTQTIASMAQQLVGVGWGGNPSDAAAVVAAYASTTGHPVTQISSNPSNNNQPGNNTPNNLGFNQQAAQYAMDVANNAAQQEYLRARLNLDTEIEANNKAQRAWQNAFDQAKFDYQKGIDAQQFGLSEGGLTGLYKGSPTLAAQLQQANITGFDANGNPTLARQGQEQQTANQYLSLLAGLRGPADAFQYMRTLQGTPNGLRDIVNAAAGRYALGTNVSGEMAPRATLASLIGDVTGGGAPGVGTAMIGAGGGDPAVALNKINVVRAQQGLPPLTSLPQSTAAPGGIHVMNFGGGTPTVQGATTMGAQADPLAGVGTLPGANQIAPRNYNAMNPSQKAMLWSAYEYGLGPTGAMRPEDAQAAYLKSLPRYTFTGTGRVNLGV